MTLEQAARQALEALIEANVVAERYQNADKRKEAITALQETLASRCQTTTTEQEDEIYWIETNKALAKEIIELKRQAEQEPVYAFRRKGQDSFCTCDKERYEELADKPNLFEVTTFYAAPVSIESAVLAEREACAKVCEEQSPLDAMVDEEFGSAAMVRVADAMAKLNATAIRARSE